MVENHCDSWQRTSSLGSLMHIRLTCDITQEQIDCGYDLTLLTIHTRFVAWIMALDTPVVGFSLNWRMTSDDEPHLIVTADLVENSPVKIDEQFFDEMHLGGREDD
jgi:hypothetical protein